MRTAILALCVVSLSAAQAWATLQPRPQPSPPTALNLINQCDGAVEVSAAGLSPVVLAPLESTTYFGTGTVTVTAKLVGTTFSATKSIKLKSGQTTVATISFTKVMLASTGGLMPLLLLGCVLGRAPRRRQADPR